MDVRRLRPGEWLAGIGGAALLAVMFMDWYGSDGEGAQANAWEAFSVVDIILAIAGLLGVALAAITAAHRAAAVPIAVASLLGSIGGLAALVLIWRVIDVPGSGAVTRESGLWIGLISCGTLLAGAVASMKDERFPRAARSNVPIETLQPPDGGRA
jgi:hypothetical protein